jgi:hypothetical protein
MDWSVLHVRNVLAVPWLRLLVAGLSPRKPEFDPGSVRVGFLVDKVALGQVFSRVLRFSPVNFIPPVFHYKEKRKKLIIFITGLHNKPQGCGASVASAAGPFPKKKRNVFSCIIVCILGVRYGVCKHNIGSWEDDLCRSVRQSVTASVHMFNWRKKNCWNIV